MSTGAIGQCKSCKYVWNVRHNGYRECPKCDSENIDVDKVSGGDYD